MSLINYTELSTKRLVLRKPSTSDAEDILFLRSDKEVNFYIKRPTPKNKEDALKFIEKVDEGIAENNLFYWCITLMDEDKMIGTICLWNFSKDKKTAEVGYDLHPSFQGNGYMHEALQKIVNFGYASLRLRRIEAFTHRENKSSKTLLLRNNFVLIPDRKDDDNANNLIYLNSKQGILKG